MPVRRLRNAVAWSRVTNLGGGGGIRTHGSSVSGEGETRSGDYKSPALNHSATPPTIKNRAVGTRYCKLLFASGNVLTLSGGRVLSRVLRLHNATGHRAS